VNDLVDTTEMYLRTVYELEEEGIVPLRARIAERLKQSGPTVSQTVARMERDDLLTVEGDRHLQLTAGGRAKAIAVMRKHRLAELLLTQVIGLAWEDVHVEACRWEHVMSEDVERKLVTLLDNPVQCPHGNPIPGLAELGAPEAPAAGPALTTLAAGSRAQVAKIVVRRISEQLQPDPAIMKRLSDAGVRPGAELLARRTGDGVAVRTDGGAETPFDELIATHVFVSAG